MKIHEKLDRIEECIQRIDKTLVKQEETLKHHVYRTDLAEQRIACCEKDLEPVKGHIKRVDGAMKLVGLVALISGIVLTAYKVFY